MNYQEMVPADPLSQFIKCIWTMEAEPDFVADPERILPDGCSEIIFNLADPFAQHHIDGSVERQATALFVGQMKHSIRIAPTGRIRLLGIRFLPGGAYPFLEIPQNELVNQIVELDTVWGRFAEEFQSQINDGTSGSRALLVEHRLLSLLKSPKAHHNTVIAASSMIVHSRGRLTIKELCDRVNTNPRALDRGFNQFVGLSPKALSKIVRFQEVLRSVSSDPDWARIAAECGYYDQAHFINDFKIFAGTEPTVFFSESNRMSDQFTGSSSSV